MRTIALCLVLAACGGVVDGGQPPPPQQVDSAACPTDVATYCSGGGPGCPATLASWCSDAGEPKAMGSGACGAMTWVGAMASIDQGIDYFYDQGGNLTAVAGWVSDPSQPCYGACNYVCLAGPKSFDTSQALACTSGGVSGASAVCGP